MRNWSGSNNPKYSHGMNRSPEHIAWKAMKQRCRDDRNYERYKDYRGRGITVCKRWKESFENFFKDMGEKPGPEYSLDRINNDKGYSKENCRWATRTIQARNSRRGIFVKYKGVTKTLSEWSRCLSPSKDKGLVGERLKRGWSVYKALTTPVKRRKK